jgi:hypothetical protein
MMPSKAVPAKGAGRIVLAGPAAVRAGVLIPPEKHFLTPPAIL